MNARWARSRSRLFFVITLALLLSPVATRAQPTGVDVPTSIDPATPVDPAIGLRLPPGFSATVFAEGVGRARHIAVAPNGTVYVALRQQTPEGGIVALKDTNNDGRADRFATFGRVSGTGIGFADGHLYFATTTTIFRWKLSDSRLLPQAQPEVLVAGMPEQRSHSARSIALDNAGHLYVNIGAPANACQESRRTPGSPGQDPCPLLERHGGIWRFATNRTDQNFDRDGERIATGVRNAVAIAWNHVADALYLVMHGRDQLHDLFPELFSVEENADLPAEEFHRMDAGANLGWPYTYWDPMRNERMVAPEYGGDGRTVSDDPNFQPPLVGFPAHWAPNGLMFYTGKQFPEAYTGGAFIAFHGSWNRAPLRQDGYNVVFQPMTPDGRPAGPGTIFADGFPGRWPISQPGQARFRPMGLGQGPDGALYIADSAEGRVWRISYTGN